jgi:hypothetical protein
MVIFLIYKDPSDPLISKLVKFLEKCEVHPEVYSYEMFINPIIESGRGRLGFPLVVIGNPEDDGAFYFHISSIKELKQFILPMINPNYKERIIPRWRR